jgi:FixJ family two-component response regulator
MSEAPLISIVDDDALARDGIRELVESLGYRAVTFNSAEHFLQSDVIVKTTCLITDVQMPGLKGLELQEALKSQGYQTPVILITAYPNEKHQTCALENGAVGYLSKPFDEQTLIECLTAAIKLQSSRARRRTAITPWRARAGFALATAVAIIRAFFQLVNLTLQYLVPTFGRAMRQSLICRNVLLLNLVKGIACKDWRVTPKDESHGSTKNRQLDFG